MEHVSLKIDGMSCGHCVRAVDQALRGLAGVRVEKVDVGSAVVACDAATAGPEQIERALSEEGYEVRSMASAS